MNENDNAEVDENQGLESPKTPDYYPDDDRDIPESPGTPDDPEVLNRFKFFKTTFQNCIGISFR